MLPAVLDPLRTARLWFMPYRPGDALVLNHFGIGEPASARARVSAADLDLVLMPCSHSTTVATGSAWAVATTTGRSPSSARAAAGAADALRRSLFVPARRRSAGGAMGRSAGQLPD